MMTLLFSTASFRCFFSFTLNLDLIQKKLNRRLPRRRHSGNSDLRHGPQHRPALR